MSTSGVQRSPCSVRLTSALFELRRDRSPVLEGLIHVSVQIKIGRLPICSKSQWARGGPAQPDVKMLSAVTLDAVPRARTDGAATCRLGCFSSEQARLFVSVEPLLVQRKIPTNMRLVSDLTVGGKLAQAGCDGKDQSQLCGRNDF